MTYYVSGWTVERRSLIQRVDRKMQDVHESNGPIK